MDVPSMSHKEFDEPLRKQAPESNPGFHCVRLSACLLPCKLHADLDASNRTTLAFLVLCPPPLAMQ
jgi:hypothetical protein